MGKHEAHTLMTYIDAAVAPLRKTGQIKIYDAEAFAAMRRAGQLVAECLDMLVPEIKPGLPTSRIDELVFDWFHTATSNACGDFFHCIVRSRCLNIHVEALRLADKNTEYLAHG